MRLQLTNILIFDPPPLILVVDSMLNDENLKILFNIVTHGSAVLCQIAVLRSVLYVVLVSSIPIAHWLLRFSYIEYFASLAFHGIYNPYL